MFLMGSTRCHLLVLGVDPFAGVHYTGFVNGDYLRDLPLGQHTGDGKFDGETFWVGCGSFFSWGLGEGKRNSRARSAWIVFSLDDVSFRTALFMLYIL